MKRAIRRYRLIRPDNDSEYLFMRVRGNSVQTTQVQRGVRNAADDAGVMGEDETRFHRKFTPHTFRTVFTTLMRQEGMSDHLLQSIRGGANNRSMDVYTRVSRDEVRREYFECIKSLEL